MRLLLLPAAVLLTAVPASAANAPPPRIAFNAGLATSNPDVVTLRPDGSDFRNLTPGTPNAYDMDLDPSWSPDGTRVAFDSHRDSNLSTEIYVMNADGSAQRRLTHDSGDGKIFDTLPLWSPGGDLIEFEQTTNGQSYDLWVTRPDGSGTRRLTSDGGLKQDVSWSPDGSRLLYSRYGSGSTRIYTVGLDGAAPVALSPAGALDANPVWSPDGSQVAFAAPALTMMRADGADRHLVTSLGAASPAWSPDGRQIAFIGVRAFPQFGSRFGIPTRRDVFVVDADGGRLHRLTGPFGDDRFDGPDAVAPTWWPDGSRLFFVRLATGPETTWVMNADGSCQGAFGPVAPDLRRPVWQPVAGPLPPIARCAEVRVTVDSGKTPVGLGETATWTLVVDNGGNQSATNVHVDVVTQDDAVLSTMGPGECTAVGRHAACTIGVIPAGGTARLTFGGTRRTGGAIRAQVSVSAEQLDTDLSNNTATAVAQVLPCTQVGTAGNDAIYGTSRRDTICGLPGADTIYGGRGNDFVDAGNGDDRIYPGKGRDTVIARGGDDVIWARDGERDWIDCGAQRDVAIVDAIDVVRHCEAVARPRRR